MNDRIKSLAIRMKDLQLDRSDPQQATLYNFTFGAIYSLARAEHLGYPRQLGEPGRSWRRIDEVKTLITRMLVEETPPGHGEWLAGYYFNDAIFRLDVAFEHVLRYVANLGPQMPIGVVSQRATEGGFPSELMKVWSARARVADRKLKHRSLAFLEEPELSFDDALAVSENLVCAVEWILQNPPGWKAQQRPL